MAIKTRKQAAGPYLRLGILACLITALSSWSAENDRVFTDLKGRTFMGQVVSFDAAAQTVTIRRVDKKTAKMEMTLFSESDRQYIRDWSFTNDFMNNVAFSVKLKSQELPDGNPTDPNMPRIISDAGYEVEIANRSATGFGKISVEYCIFYKQGERQENEVLYRNGTCYGQYAIDGLKLSAKNVAKTKTVKIYSQSGYLSAFGWMNPSQGDVQGIWLRAKTILPSGGEVVREFRTSNNAEWRWVAYSIGVGLNESDSTSQFMVIERK